MPADFTVVEADIKQLRHALESGNITSVELVTRYLNRVGFYDRSGTALNAIPVLNPDVFEDARASDLRRLRGELRGPLEGIPFTVKDSYSVRGMTVANGSPAFENLIAGDDAFTVAQLRAAGAILLGLTNMPPMAGGGMQRGVYGRAESPYDGDYLTAAFGSGSSNGSGTATAACFAAFGLGEETWSSGRAPASNNALVAYTPSRGVISVRGNWPLVPTMDVVVPHARSVADLKEMLDVLVVDDSTVAGDLWRSQPWLALPAPSKLRPESFVELSAQPLAGKRFAVPKLYINADDQSRYPIEVRDSVMALWNTIRAELEAAGAEVVETDFPAAENYERLIPGAQDSVARGFIPADYWMTEVTDLAAWSMDTFLRLNGDPALPDFGHVDPDKIFPQPDGALHDRYGVFDYDIAVDFSAYVAKAQAGLAHFTEIPGVAEGMKGLEVTRKVDFEDWLDAGGFDAVIFPAAADVGPANADVDSAAAALAWRNGVWVSMGNLVPRHLGIPTVTVPMGLMSDIGMPVGLTIAGRAYDDVELVGLAHAVESLSKKRVAPPRTPALADEAPLGQSIPLGESNLHVQIEQVRLTDSAGSTSVDISARVSASTNTPDIAVFVNGVRVKPTLGEDGVLSATAEINTADVTRTHSQWRQPYGPLVVIVARSADGSIAGALATSEGTPL